MRCVSIDQKRPKTQLELYDPAPQTSLYFTGLPHSSFCRGAFQGEGLQWSPRQVLHRYVSSDPRSRRSLCLRLYHRNILRHSPQLGQLAQVCQRRRINLNHPRSPAKGEWKAYHCTSRQSCFDDSGIRVCDCFSCCKHLFDVDLHKLAEACGGVGAREKLFKPFDQLGFEVLFFVLHVCIIQPTQSLCQPLFEIFQGT